MSGSRRPFKRELGKKRYKKLFVVSFEGSKTEPQYFAMVSSLFSNIHIHSLKTKLRSSPKDVLKRVITYISDNKFDGDYSAWIVIDKDDWPNEQLEELHLWSEEKDVYNLAISNPKFEYWLLLHFENGTGLSSKQDCCRRLERYLDGYDKKINARNFDLSKIESAISHAKTKDKPASTDWNLNFGVTTVYKLLEDIVNSNSNN